MNKNSGNFWRDESGQSMIFAAFTFFALMVMAMMILGVGSATSKQIQLQNAADSAAYSGSLVEADCLAQIAWMNEGMAQMYARSLEAAANNAAMATYAELEEIKPYYDTKTYLAGVNIPSVQPAPSIVGVNNARAQYETTFATAKKIIPQAEQWLTVLSKLQRGIAAYAPALVESQIYYTAKKNGSERTAMYRRFSFLPDGGGRKQIHIKLLGEYETGMSSGAYPPSTSYIPWPFIKTGEDLGMANPVGWEAWEKGVFTLRITHAVHHDPALYSTDSGGNAAWAKLGQIDKYFAPWRFPSAGNFDNADAMKSKMHDLYRLELTEGSNEMVMRFGSKFPKRIGNTEQSKPAYYWLHLSQNGADPVQKLFIYDEDGSFTMRDPLTGDFSVTQLENGIMIEYPDKTKVVLRYADGGGMEQWFDDDGDDVQDEDEWRPLDDNTTKMINGVEVPISENSWIPVGLFGGKQISVRVGTPLRVRISGVLDVRLADPLRIVYLTRAGWLTIKEGGGVADDAARINGLSTLTDADGTWRDWAQDSYRATSRSDRIMHRIAVEEPQPGVAGTPYQWLYEIVQVGSFLEDMPMRKLAMHGLLDMNLISTVVPNTVNITNSKRSPSEKGDANWVAGSTDDDAWAKSGNLGQSVWRNFPAWARPARTPNISKGDLDTNELGGIIDLDTGGPHTQHDGAMQPGGGAFSQTRTCWFCGKVGVSGKLKYWGPGDHDASTESPSADSYSRPCGFFHLDEKYALNTIAAQFPVGSFYLGRVYDLPLDDPKRKLILLEIRCPLLCQQDFTSPPTYNVTKMFYGIAGTPPTETTKVRVYLANAFGKASRNGAAFDPLKDGSLANNAMDPLVGGVQVRDYYKILMDYRDPTLYEKPLQLTNQFFRDSLTVATWASGLEKKLLDQFGSATPTAEDKANGMYNPLEGTDWGYYAVASARALMPVPDVVGGKSNLAATFPWLNPKSAEDDYNALAASSREPEDIIGFPKNYQRQLYLEGSSNLFDPGWTGMLVATRTAVDMRDLYMYKDLQNTIGGGSGTKKINDSSARFILDKLRTGGWAESVLESGNGVQNIDMKPRQGWGRMKAPPIQKGGGNVDYNDQKIGDSMRH